MPMPIPSTYKAIMVALIALATVKCTTYSQDQFAKDMEYWRGRSEKELIDTLGYPDQHHTSPEHRPVYEYRHQVLYVDRYPLSFYRPLITPVRSEVRRYECRVWFELADQKVLNITWRGNDCVAAIP